MHLPTPGLDLVTNLRNGHNNRMMTIETRYMMNIREGWGRKLLKIISTYNIQFSCYIGYDLRKLCVLYYYLLPLNFD